MQFYTAYSDKQLTKHEWQKDGLWLSKNGPDGREEPEIYSEMHTRMDLDRYLSLVQFQAMDVYLQHWEYGVTRTVR
jgi:hypothetical protein